MDNIGRIIIPDVIQQIYGFREGDVIDIETCEDGIILKKHKEDAVAEWKWNSENGYYYCPECQAVSPRENQYGDYIDCPNYCHNCGAKLAESR